jgi:ribonuclease PH
MFLIKFTLPFNFSSVVFEMGNTKVIATVYGPREVPCKNHEEWETRLEMSPST